MNFKKKALIVSIRMCHSNMEIGFVSEKFWKFGAVIRISHFVAIVSMKPSDWMMHLIMLQQRHVIELLFGGIRNWNM